MHPHIIKYVNTQGIPGFPQLVAGGFNSALSWWQLQATLNLTQYLSWPECGCKSWIESVEAALVLHGGNKTRAGMTTSAVDRFDRRTGTG